jgi:hypothetical protein
MTDYNGIPDAEIDPDKFLSSTTLRKLRDNPIAITEGASGAPKMQAAGIADGAVRLNHLPAPAAGDTYVIHHFTPPGLAINGRQLDVLPFGSVYEVFERSGDGSVPPYQMGHRWSTNKTRACQCLVSGTVRFRGEHRRPSTGTSFLRVLRNATQVAEWSTSSDWQSRTVDITVTAGDVIMIQQSGDTSVNSEMRNCRLLSSVNTLAFI